MATRRPSPRRRRPSAASGSWSRVRRASRLACSGTTRCAMIIDITSLVPVQMRGEPQVAHDALDREDVGVADAAHHLHRVVRPPSGTTR